MITFYVERFNLNDVSKSEICIFLGVFISFCIFVSRYFYDRNYFWLLVVIFHLIIPIVLIYINCKTSYYINLLDETLIKVIAMPFFTLEFTCSFSEVKEIQYEEFTKRFIFIQKKFSFLRFVVHRNEDEVQALISLFQTSFHSLSFVYVEGFGSRRKIVKEKSFIL